MAEEPEDPLQPFRKKDGSLPYYLERAYALYESSSFFMAALREHGNAHKAARDTCEEFGHDAPDGRCLRCGLGGGGPAVKTDSDNMRDRIRKRDAWLEERRGVR